MIVSLVGALATGAQSCAVSYTSNVAERLGKAAGESTKETHSLAAAGGFGVIGAIMWLIAGALVMSRPRVSTWIFAASAVPWVAARTQGFHDAAGWAIASVVLAVMARAGEREKLKAEVAAATAPPAAVSVAVAPVAPPAGWYSDPDGGEGRRWWDGTGWTDVTEQR